MMLGINVIYSMKPGQRQAFLEAIGACGAQAAVRGEEGCLQYDYFLPADREDEVLLMEKWTSREAQQVHLIQPHMAQIREIKERFVDDTKVQMYDLRPSKNSPDQRIRRER